MSQPVEIRRRSQFSNDTRQDDELSAGASNLALSLSRSIEISSALHSRSPWILSSGASPMDDSLSRAHDRIDQQRDRALSCASRLTMSTHGDNVSVEEGDENGDELDDASAASLGLLNAGRMRTERDDIGRYEGGMSSFTQTLFNAMNMLMGVGLLSLPYAMRLAGWFGVVVLVICSGITCYTAQILGKIQDYVPAKKLRDGPGAYTIQGFHDMGGLVLGEYGRIFISVIFILETFGYCCVFLIIEGENLSHQLGDYAIFQSWGKSSFMAMSALLFLPSCLLRNLSWLSYFSAVGVIASVSLLVGLVTTGLIQTPPNAELCKPPCTGSLLHPAPTDMIHVDRMLEMLGLVMVGFAGHAVFPTLRNDMTDKRAYPKMVYVTYMITCTSYILMACAGYAMFGNDAQSEITMNLSTKSLIAQTIIWIVIVNPVTKFALDLAPIALGLEGYLTMTLKLEEDSKAFVLLSCLLRCLLVGLALTIVIWSPSFTTVLGVLGSLCSFTISVSFPSYCHVILFWNQLGWPERIFNIVCTITGTFLAFAGTWASLTGVP